MTGLRVMTFNVENMLVRFDFKKNDEGLVSLLDVDSELERAELIRNYWNVINDETRVFTALCMRSEMPDVICLQEVENLHALKMFHDRYLKRISGVDYPYKILIEGNDPRGIDVAVLSRFKIESASTHQDMKAEINYPDGKKTERVFRRDCLEVNVKKDKRTLPIFVCHFKSMSPDRDDTRPVRYAEASAVRAILEERFGDPSKKDWIVVGDLNDYTETDGQPDAGNGLQPLIGGGFAVDLVKRIKDPLDRWTHFYSADNSYHQIDYIIASPSLAAKNKDCVPRIIRQGQPFRAERHKGPRWPRVGFDRPKASDHCPVVVDLEI
jgi:endonuclease/exonuclease/phosphatase family metal-dependent hydrolase